MNEGIRRLTHQQPLFLSLFQLINPDFEIGVELMMKQKEIKRLAG